MALQSIYRGKKRNKLKTIKSTSREPEGPHGSPQSVILKFQSQKAVEMLDSPRSLTSRKDGEEVGPSDIGRHGLQQRTLTSFVGIHNPHANCEGKDLCEKALQRLLLGRCPFSL